LILCLVPVLHGSIGCQQWEHLRSLSSDTS
jgi:hypothetical protein